MLKEREFEVRLLDSNGEAVRVFALWADTERDLLTKTEELVGKSGAAFEVRPLSPYYPAYHPHYSRLHKY